jgi:hypothetical protein
MVRTASKHSGYRPRESISETLEYKSGILATKPHHPILAEVVYVELIVLFNCCNRLANYDVIATHVVYLKLLLHRKYSYAWGNEDKVPRTGSHRSRWKWMISTRPGSFSSKERAPCTDIRDGWRNWIICLTVYGECGYEKWPLVMVLEQNSVERSMYLLLLEFNGNNRLIKSAVLPHVCVTVDWVWIGDSIYWSLIHSRLVTTLYRSLTHTDYCPQSITVSTSRFMATDFNTVTITVSVNYTLQILHIKSSLHSRTFQLSTFVIN